MKQATISPSIHPTRVCMYIRPIGTKPWRTALLHRARNDRAEPWVGQALKRGSWPCMHLTSHKSNESFVVVVTCLACKAKGSSFLAYGPCKSTLCLKDSALTPSQEQHSFSQLPACSPWNVDTVQRSNLAKIRTHNLDLVRLNSTLI